MDHGSKLPLDVQETIIDESADDVFTLRHCALTCRDWLPRSRFHLLSAVCISTQEDIYSFCNFLDTHPNYRTLVRSVTMAPVITEKRPACLVGVFPIPILSRLPQLHRWVIRNDPFRGRRLKVSYHSTTLEQLRTHTSSPIVNLYLKDLSFVSRSELLRLVASFTQLKHLQCDTIGFDRRDSLDSEGSKPRSLRKLRLSTLLMRRVSRGVLRALLESATSTLESLVVTSSELLAYPDHVKAVGFPQMPMLHSLTFEIGYDSRTVHEGWDAMEKALDGANIPRIKSLTSNIEDYGPEAAIVYDPCQLPLSDQAPHSRRVLPQKKFAKLCEEGLSPEVVYSDLDATFFDVRDQAERIAVSPSGRWVASSIQCGAALWNMMPNDSSLKPWRAPPFFLLSEGNVSHIVFSPDSARLLVVSDKVVAHVWDVEQRRRVSTITCDSDLVVGAWSPACIVLATRAGTVSTYDPSTYRQNGDYALEDVPWSHSPSKDCDWKHRSCRPGLLFSPDNRWIAASRPQAVDSSECAWAIWRVGEGGDLTRHAVLSSTGEAFGISNSHDGHQVAFNSESTRVAVSHDLEVHVWDVATAMLLLSVDLAMNGVRRIKSLSIAFSPDGRHLLVIRDGKVMFEVWDAETGCFLKQSTLEEAGRDGEPQRSPPWIDASFSPCGRFILSSFISARGVLVWRTEDGSLVIR